MLDCDLHYYTLPEVSSDGCERTPDRWTASARACRRDRLDTQREKNHLNRNSRAFRLAAFQSLFSNDSDSNVWVKKQHSIKVVSKIYFRKSQILKPDIAKKSFTFTSPTKSFSNKWPAKGFARQISNLHTMSLQHLWWSLNNKVDCYESFFLPWKFSSKSRLISSLKW